MTRPHQPLLEMLHLSVECARAIYHSKEVQESFGYFCTDSSHLTPIAKICDNYIKAAVENPPTKKYLEGLDNQSYGNDLMEVFSLAKLLEDSESEENTNDND